MWSVGRLSLLPCVVAAMICWQLQETTRAGLRAHFRERDALPGDVLSYLGRAALLIVLFDSASATVVVLAASRWLCCS